MDSVLELDQHEITQIKTLLAESKDLFKQNAAALFEDSFLVLTTTQTKQENFQILRQL
jgi:hypothetical protein